MTTPTPQPQTEAGGVPPAPTAPPAPPEPPSLDRSGDTWIGLLPGLGAVRIAPDGGIEVTVEPAATATTHGAAHPDAGESEELRAAALRHGWAEGLSWARRGYRLAAGAAVCAPGDERRCLVLAGDPHDTAIVLIQLVNRGWTVMGDKYTPTRWVDGTLVASARSAPLLMAARRLAKADLEGFKVRAHTDARAVELPRALGTREVAAFCSLRMRKPDEEVLEVLTGAQRFEASASIMLGGALYPASTDAETEGEEDLAAEAGDPEPTGGEGLSTEDRARLAAEAMAEQLRLVAIPQLRLSLDSATAEDDTGRLCAWWDEALAAPTEAS
ncbi:MAG: hypothetical protein E6Q90_07430 [Actinobacteria bacterium]|nr:MAG: hypothetical protein E6Q90_07430 [Actinomycetota bacterium]